MSKLLESSVLASGDKLAEALDVLAGKLGLSVCDSPMPISKFKANYSELLCNAMAGQLQQISRGKERYLVLSEAQVIAMMRSSSKRTTLADTLASIQTPSGFLDDSMVMLPGSMHDPYTLSDLSS